MVLVYGIELYEVLVGGLCGKGWKICFGVLLMFVCVLFILFVVLCWLCLCSVLLMGGYVVGFGGIVVWFIGILLLVYE